MSFDFPASPTPGTVYSAPGGPTYIFDGTAWAVTDPAPAVRIESYDLAGLSQKDLIVPAWGPTTARLTLAVVMGAGSTVYLRVSLDGTTFLSGASDYQQVGYSVYEGTNSFLRVAGVMQTMWNLTPGGTHTGLPFTADATVFLTRSSSSYFSYRTRGFANHSAAGNLNTINDLQGYMNIVTGAPFAIKALRVLPSGALPTHGRLTVEWLP